MHFGTLLCIQISLLVWFGHAAPSLPSEPSIEESLSNNDTTTFSPTISMEASSPVEFDLFNFSDIITDASQNVTELPQEPLQCDKSEQSWMCPPPDNYLGSIPLDITFEPTQLIIKCSENISCAQFPVLDREVGAVQALKLQWCEALSASCVIQNAALPPSLLRRLTLDGTALDNINELVGLEKLTFNGYGKSNEDPWVVPLKSLQDMSSLRTLCIRGGHAVLPEGGFSDRAPLLHLELANLGMSRLPEKSFVGLDKLTSLGLWNNKLKELDPDVFYGLKALTSLSLSGNQLTSIPSSSLAHVPTLTELMIKSNHLKRIDAGDFNGLYNLTTLDLSDNRAELTISAGAFAELTSLVSLRVIGSRVTSVSSLGAPALRLLDLSRNLLGTLPADAFRSATGLTTLLIDSNKIEKLPRNLLQFQTSLETLSLSNNHLLDVNLRSALAGARMSLRTLRLSKNGISFDSPHMDLYSPLQDLLYLSDLDLSYNLIADVFNDWQYNMLQLQSLNLSHNRISILVEEATRFLANNVTVDLRYNYIKTVQVGDGGSSGGFGGGSGGSATLLLAHNPLHCDCSLHALLRLPRAASAPALEATAGFTLVAPAGRLRLDDAACAEPKSLNGSLLATLPLHSLTCAMSTCPRDCRCIVRPATAAVELTCWSWPMSDALPTLPALGYAYVLRLENRLAADAALADLGALPTAIRVLNCSGLGLYEPPASNSTPRVELEEVDLSNNRLHTPPELALAKGGPRVLLAGNPLRCDCDHSAALTQLAARAAHADHVARADYAALHCKEGGAVSAAGSAAALCLARHAAIAGGVLGALALLLLAAALLLWHYSLELRVWLATRGLLMRWVDTDDLQCEFDAFVSYSHLDEKFVVEELVPALEGARRPRLLCLHYRDWHAGEPIAANVARSVQRSRRTLVVLSRNFLESEWGRLELRVAVAAALRSARGVLLVLLEDVAGDPRLDGELAAYLATHTYLRHGDPHFWPRLLRALPATAHRLRDKLPRLIEQNSVPVKQID